MKYFSLSRSAMNFDSKRTLRSSIYRDLKNYVTGVTTRDIILETFKILRERDALPDESPFQSHIRIINLYRTKLPIIILLIVSKAPIDWSNPNEIGDSIIEKDKDLKADLYKKVSEGDMKNDESIPIANVPIPCRHCGEKKVRMISKNIRAFDEPATWIYSCLACGKGWSIS